MTSQVSMMITLPGDGINTVDTDHEVEVDYECEWLNGQPCVILGAAHLADGSPVTLSEGQADIAIEAAREQEGEQ